VNDRTSNALLFTLVQVVIPAFVSVYCRGIYVSKDLGAFWIGPYSTSIPYAVLALIFLVHRFGFNSLVDRSGFTSESHRGAYCGASMAWLSMMTFTVFIICQTYQPRSSAFVGIVMVRTFYWYIPLLVLPYIIGAIVGKLWTKKEEGKYSETL